MSQLMPQVVVIDGQPHVQYVPNDNNREREELQQKVEREIQAELAELDDLEDRWNFLETQLEYR
jgi:hypothetical protein